MLCVMKMTKIKNDDWKSDYFNQSLSHHFIPDWANFLLIRDFLFLKLKIIVDNKFNNN